jgi:hypothetical protein
MARHEFDKSSKWLLQKHGKGILFLGGLRDVRSCRALQAEMVQPRQLPDGLLEVYVEGSAEPVHVVVEVSTYPEKRAREQGLDDLTLAYQQLGVLPELLIVVLCRKGRFRVGDKHEVRSRLGWSKLAGAWKPVELWTLKAEELLAAPDVGLVPWATLADFSERPEALLERCRRRIEELARPDERANLLAVSQVLAKLRFDTPEMLAILGGRQVMIESPLIQEIVAERFHEAILTLLAARFGSLPVEITTRVQSISKEKTLLDLNTFAGTCPDLNAFRERLLS